MSNDIDKIIAESTARQIAKRVDDEKRVRAIEDARELARETDMLGHPPHPRYRVVPVLLVEIHGEPHPRGFPYMPLDGGRVHAFLTRPDRPFPLRTLSVGGGSYVALHEVGETADIITWLQENGATPACDHVGCAWRCRESGEPAAGTSTTTDHETETEE